MSIYIDELFVINLVAALTMLNIFAFFMRLKKYRFRIIIAGAVGAALAVLRFLYADLGAVFFAAEIFIPFIAFRKCSVKMGAVFTLIRYAATGLAVLCISFWGGAAAVIRGGIIYFDISLIPFAIILTLTYILLYGAAAIIRAKREKRFYTLKLSCGENSVTLRALYDSGNLLKNPYDGGSVIVAALGSIEKIWDGSFILIPFHAVGTREGMMKAFKAQSVYFVESGKTVKNVTIGISEGVLSKNGSAEALIGPGFFKEEE